MACRKYRHLLPLCMDGVCLDEPDVRRLQAHLAVCPECAREAEKYCAMVDLISKQCTLPIEVPQDFCTRVMQKLNAETAAAPHLGFLWPPLVAGSVGAAAFLLVLVAFQPLNRSDLSPDTLSNLRPALESQTMPPLAAKTSAPARAEKLAQTLFRASRTQAADALTAEPDLIRRVTQRVRGEEEALPAGEYAGLAQTVAYAPGAALPVYAGSAAAPMPANRVAPSPRPSEWSGEWCALSRPEQMIVRSPEDLARLQTRAGLTPPVGEIAWGRQMLVAVFIGAQPGKGYEIHLTSVVPQNQQLLIKYHISPPAGADRLDSRVSRPYLLALIPSSNLPAVFEAE